jgi:Tfp pilus assembly protein PilN
MALLWMVLGAVALVVAAVVAVVVTYLRGGQKGPGE